jgi:hypothetical protein
MLKKRFFPMSLVLVGLGLILMSASVYWLVRATQKPIVIPTATTATDAAPDMPYPEVKRISLVEAKAAFDQKKALFVDARGEPYFSEGHIPGAIALSPDQVQAKISELGQKTWIITYCT